LIRYPHFFAALNRAQNTQQAVQGMAKNPVDLRMFYIQRPAPVLPDLPGLQTYFPSLEVLFPSLEDHVAGTPTLAASELALDISGDTARVEHMINNTVRSTPVWIRKVHLLEPLDVLEGEYVMPRDGALPAFRSAWQRTLRKINDPYNEAYTDAVFACMASRLVETGRSPHFCRFFGTFNGRAPEYSYDITPDMSDIEGENWFRDGLKAGIFKVVVSDPYDPDVTAELTQPWEDVRCKLLRDEGSITSESDEDVSDSDGDTGDSASGSAKDEELSDLEEMDMEVSGEATVVRPRLRLQRVQRSGSVSDSGSGSGGSSLSDDELEYRIFVKDFPIQATVMERCDGTMDDLMEDEIADDATADMRDTKEQRWTAWIFQVIAALTTVQSTYDFVHNDLHTNNVMWCGTGETHIYYHVSGGAGGDRYYRVPTYGRIFKIIDFGRATFRPPAVRDNHVWFPDVYGPGGDAAEQYNCGPYYNQKKPKVVPNKSFDLCRLAVAILDTLWSEEPVVAQGRKIMTREPGRHQAETVSPLWNLLWLWLTDRNGRNILKTPDDRERYKTFDLYCAIARDAVNAVPAQQLTLPMFDSTFRCKRRDIPAEATIYKLQAVHRHT
jgi:hypothetical protein